MDSWFFIIRLLKRIFLFHRSDQLMDIFHSIFLHVGPDAVDDVDGGRGIYKVGGSDGYAGGSCKDKFQRILSGGDAAHADDGDLTALATW